METPIELKPTLNIWNSGLPKSNPTMDNFNFALPVALGELQLAF